VCGSEREAMDPGCVVMAISLCAVLDRVFEDEQEDRENPLRTPIRRPGIERDVVSCVNEIVSWRHRSASS
jgi:hypothetical protein